MEKFLNYLALATSLTIAGIAAYFSVIGLATIFAGAFLGVVIMTGVLEFGKVVTAAYLHLFWDKLNYMKYYLTASVVVLMLITSLGIFGYLAKASSDTSYATGVAQSEITRLNSSIAREENKIEILEERIDSLTTGSLDVTDSVNAQIEIRDGAWDRVQGDIDFAQVQINSLRAELKSLDDAVNELRNKGVEVITTDEGGVFQGAETETIDYVAQANILFEQQKEQREQIVKNLWSEGDYSRDKVLDLMELTEDAELVHFLNSEEVSLLNGRSEGIKLFRFAPLVLDLPVYPNFIRTKESKVAGIMRLVPMAIQFDYLRYSTIREEFESVI